MDRASVAEGDVLEERGSLCTPAADADGPTRGHLHLASGVMRRPMSVGSGGAGVDPVLQRSETMAARYAKRSGGVVGRPAPGILQCRWQVR